MAYSLSGDAATVFLFLVRSTHIIPLEGLCKAELRGLFLREKRIYAGKKRTNISRKFAMQYDYFIFPAGHLNFARCGLFASSRSRRQNVVFRSGTEISTAPKRCGVFPVFSTTRGIV